MYVHACMNPLSTWHNTSGSMLNQVNTRVSEVLITKDSQKTVWTMQDVSTYVQCSTMGQERQHKLSLSVIPDF